MAKFCKASVERAYRELERCDRVVNKDDFWRKLAEESQPKPGKTLKPESLRKYLSSSKDLSTEYVTAIKTAAQKLGVELETEDESAARYVFDPKFINMTHSFQPNATGINRLEPNVEYSGSHEATINHGSRTIKFLTKGSNPQTYTAQIYAKRWQIQIAAQHGVSFSEPATSPFEYAGKGTDKNLAVWDAPDLRDLGRNVSGDLGEFTGKFTTKDKITLVVDPNDIGVKNVEKAYTEESRELDPELVKAIDAAKAEMFEEVVNAAASGSYTLVVLPVIEED